MHTRVRAHGSRLPVCSAGETAHVWIEARDLNGAPLSHVAECLAVRVRTPAGDELPAEVVLDPNGQYRADFAAPLAGGYQVLATANGTQIRNSPADFTVPPGPPFPPLCSAEVQSAVD